MCAWSETEGGFLDVARDETGNSSDVGLLRTHTYSMMMTYAMNVCRNNRPHHVMHSIPRGTGGLFGTGLNCIPQQHVSLSALHNTHVMVC